MESKIGQKRKFSFSENPYEVLEIIDSPNLSMDWEWNTGTQRCPYCGRLFKSKSTVRHDFYKIEILGATEFIGKNEEEKNNIEKYKLKKNLTKDDIVIMGYTLDRRYMLIPKEKSTYNMALSLSKKFKKFLIER